MRPVPDARRARLIASALALLACGQAAATQNADALVPPQPDRGLGLYSPVAGYALMALATAAIIGINLLPAKRGHQD